MRTAAIAPSPPRAQHLAPSGHNDCLFRRQNFKRLKDLGPATVGKMCQSAETWCGVRRRRAIAHHRRAPCTHIIDSLLSRAHHTPASAHPRDCKVTDSNCTCNFAFSVYLHVPRGRAGQGKVTASRLQLREVPGCNLSQSDSLFARSDISTRRPVRSQIGHLYKTSHLRSHISKRRAISDLTC